MKPISVGQLLFFLNRTLLQDPLLKNLSIEGEVVNYRSTTDRRYRFFDLRDPATGGTVHCFMDALSVRIALKNGMKMRADGMMRIYEKTGQLQFYLRSAQEAGEGMYQRAFQELYDRLREEGLFDREKRPLPVYPDRIGLITSQDGAAIHDFLRTLQERYPLAKVFVADARVQGEEAASSICERLSSLQNCVDVVVITRGGGSQEDLVAFNDEQLVRSIAQCKVPVLSAIGHEYDTTLCDLVADQRASTPTKAAVSVSPRTVDQLRLEFEAKSLQMQESLQKKCNEWRWQCRTWEKTLKMHHPRRIFAEREKHLDVLEDRMRGSAQMRCAKDRILLQAQEERFSNARAAWMRSVEFRTATGDPIEISSLKPSMRLQLSTMDFILQVQVEAIRHLREEEDHVGEL